jgi:NADP-dependent 3-hydroxy acid dehydrogenase YdfG
MSTLKDQVVVITGGSKGFGFATAKKLMLENAKLALIARNENDLEKAKIALLELKSDAKIFIISCDVSNSKQVNETFKNIHKHYERIDHFVNNAGLAKISKSEDCLDADIEVQINTNLLGNIYCCRAAIPYLKESAQQGSNSRIINTSSATAFHTDEMAHMSVYAATKSALERFSRELRRELENDEIGVSIVRPGAVMDTDFSSNLNFDLLKPALDAWQDSGPYCYQGMDSSHVADAIEFCLRMPKGVSVDLLEIRPNKRMKKPVFKHSI